MNLLEFKSRIKEVKAEIAEDRKQKQSELLRAIDGLRRWVVDESRGDSDFSSFDGKLRPRLNEVGVRAGEYFLATQRKVPEKQKMKDSLDRAYTYEKEKTYKFRSEFGEGEYRSSKYRRGKRGGENRELVLLRGQVGLLPFGSMSPCLALEVAELATRMPFDHVHEVLRRFLGYVPSQRSIQGIIDHLGPHAGVVLDDLPCEAGNIAIIQTDARGLPHIRPEEYKKRCKPHKKRKGEGKRRRHRNKEQSKERRTKGKKAKNKKRVTVGVIYTLQRLPDGSVEGPLGKKLIAQRGPAEEVFKRLHKTLDEMGEVVDHVVFISDGDPQYMTLREKYFPEATAVVDFYHVCEYLWKAGGTIYKEGTTKLVGFVRNLKALLLDDKVNEVLRILREKQKEIPKTGPGTKGRRNRMRISINYISKRVKLMPYKELREQGLDIGSGVIESAVRQVVAIRFDGPGMRWGDRRPQFLLHLLCLRLSDGWMALLDHMREWSHLANHTRRITPLGVNENKRKPKTSKVDEEETTVPRETVKTLKIQDELLLTA